MALCWRGAKPLLEPMLDYCQLDSWEQISVKFETEFYHFHSRICIWNCLLPKWQPFSPGGDALTSLECAVVLSPGSANVTFNSFVVAQWPNMALLSIVIIGYNDLAPIQCRAITTTNAQDAGNITHWGLNKMAIILQTTLSNTFSQKEISVFWLKFHLSLTPWS